jgi:hypothetical protein
VGGQPMVTIRLVSLDDFLSLHETVEDAVLAVEKSKPGTDPTSTL